MHYFLVYNDNTHWDYLSSLLESVKKHGKEFIIILFNKEEIDNDFKTKYNNILSLNRGGGYWLWKPYIINETLKKIKDGDIVFYLDSKYYFTEEFTGLFEAYLSNNDLLVWKNKPSNPVYCMKNWCKMDVVLKYGMYDKVFKKNIEDCWGGALVIRKTDNTLKYIDEWLNMCCIYENITDSPSIEPNDAQFNEHRHDQSLLSIILHKYNITLQFFERRYLQNVRTPY